MPIKVDGTNGVLQTYDFQVLTTGFSYTFAAGTITLIANPAGTLATGTITMPAAPADGMVITIQSTQQITALTIQGNTGQSLVGGAITMRANQPESFVYRLSNTTWYPFAGAANTQIISGTSVASTSGSSISFTGIPSWVKRVTVVFSGVSMSTSGVVYIRLGTSSGSVTSGYLGNTHYLNTGSQTQASTYIPVDGTSLGAPATRQGTYIFNNVTGNTWTGFGITGNSNDVGQSTVVGGIVLGATLDRVLIETSAGTFDAGTINILYE
jgi:hypothetical protein